MLEWRGDDEVVKTIVNEVFVSLRELPSPVRDCGNRTSVIKLDDNRECTHL